MTTDASSARNARRFPARSVVPALVRDPLQTLEEISGQSGNEVTQLNLGTFRPYLVSRPEHIQHVLRDNAENYRREGLLWKPLSRLVGEPSGADPAWPLKKNVYQSLLSGPNIASFTDEMAASIMTAVDDLAMRAGDGQPVDAGTEITRIVFHAILRVFVGDKISMAEGEEIGRALIVATDSSFRARMLFPYVPFWMHLPGDRAFNRAVQVVDDLVIPLVETTRRHGAGGNDLVSRLIRARDENGRALSDKEVRDGIVALFVAGTETTVKALSYLWVVLDSYPDVARKLFAEIDQTVGTEQPSSAHLPHLKYTKMVVQELLRMYGPAWILPRTVVADDVIDGVRIKKNSIIVVSPYLAHRQPDHWPAPDVFDPERFSAKRGERRHRFAYLPFGAGPHQCVGSLLFTVESQLILASMISRLRPALHPSQPITLRADLTVKTREPVEITVRPRRLEDAKK
ncbi:cytochrome P450 [Actinomadura viridis]|uniref:cytochrome P450 n=1 Tax=Actinomadura viridis TaxID=58110 RepID=UPI0036AD1183